MTWLSKCVPILTIFAFAWHAVAQNQCNQMPITTAVINSSTQSKSAFEHMLCDSDFKTHEEARNAGIGVGVVVYGVPLTLNGTFSQSEKSAWKHQHCESSASSSSFAESYQSLMKFVSAEAYKAWSDCQRVNSFGVSCWLEAADDDDDQLVFRTRWNPVPGDSGNAPRVTNTTIAGATKAGSSMIFPPGTDVSLNPSAILTRQADTTVVAVVNTNRGSCPAYAPKPKPIFETVYVNADPATGQAYQQSISFDKNPYYTGRPRGEGHEIIYNYTAPGPIASVQCNVQPGGGGGWTHTEICSFQGTNAHWEGWSNSGDHATIVLAIQYKMPTQQCRKHCT